MSIVARSRRCVEQKIIKKYEESLAVSKIVRTFASL